MLLLLLHELLVAESNLHQCHFPNYSNYVSDNNNNNNNDDDDDDDDIPDWLTFC